MKYLKRKMTKAEVGQAVKSLLLLGEKKITVEVIEDGTYKVTTEKV